MNQITPGMGNGANKGNTKVHIELPASEPFMIVFVEFRETLTEDTHKPVSSRAGQGASDYPIAQVRARIST